MGLRRLVRGLGPRGPVGCRLRLTTDPPAPDATGAPDAGCLVAARPERVTAEHDRLVAGRTAVFRVGGANELPPPAHLRLRPARHHALRVRDAAGGPVPAGLRLRIHHHTTSGTPARDTVVLDVPGTGGFDTRSDTEAVGLEVIVPPGGWAPHELTVEFDEVGERPALERFVLIPGAMKSGTTTLHGYLRQHPAICPSRRKEPEFFSSPAHTGGPVAYRDLFALDGRTHRIGLDASTGYTKVPGFPDVAARLAAFPADFRFVYVMRDPVDRIESHLAHNVARGRLTPEQALDAEARHDAAVAVSSYASQLDRYAAAFPDLGERLLLVDFDELVATPLPVLRRVEALLGLGPHDYRDVGAKNTRKSRHGSDRVRLDPAMRARLRARLRDDLTRLVDEYGFDAARRWLEPPDGQG